MENMNIFHPESHMFFNQGITIHDPYVVETMTTHISPKTGLKIWGKGGTDSIYSEMIQLHMRDTFLPLHWKNMSHEHRKQ